MNHLRYAKGVFNPFPFFLGSPLISNFLTPLPTPNHPSLGIWFYFLFLKNISSFKIFIFMPPPSSIFLKLKFNFLRFHFYTILPQPHPQTPPPPPYIPHNVNFFFKNINFEKYSSVESLCQISESNFRKIDGVVF